jgi:tetratricopeptide (TPR) repeat protein
VKHRPLAARLSHDARVSTLSWRSLALWLLGYPEAALADREHAIKDAREIGQAAALMTALTNTTWTLFHCGDYVEAGAQADELLALADKKGALHWKAHAMLHQGYLLAQTGNASEAVQVITSGIGAFRSAGSAVFMPLYLS